MKALVQRVRHASVEVEGKVIGNINKGLLIFLGVGHDDTEAIADKLLHKVLHYRIFSDANGKMNCDVQDVQGDLLIVSQFTLMAETAKGLRPSFTPAAAPAEAERLYQYFASRAQAVYASGRIATGQFAADMQVSLLNDGPVTFMLEVI